MKVLHVAIIWHGLYDLNVYNWLTTMNKTYFTHLNYTIIISKNATIQAGLRGTLRRLAFSIPCYSCN